MTHDIKNPATRLDDRSTSKVKVSSLYPRKDPKGNRMIPEADINEQLIPHRC